MEADWEATRWTRTSRLLAPTHSCDTDHISGEKCDYVFHGKSLWPPPLIWCAPSLESHLRAYYFLSSCQITGILLPFMSLVWRWPNRLACENKRIYKCDLFLALSKLTTTCWWETMFKHNQHRSVITMKVRWNGAHARFHAFYLTIRGENAYTVAWKNHLWNKALNVTIC